MGTHLVFLGAAAILLVGCSPATKAVLNTASPVFGTEWHYLEGVILLRVSGKLPPSANDRYAAAFAGLRRWP